MNPFDLKPKPMDDLFMDWQSMSRAPYDKRAVDPYTRSRVILLNGIESDGAWFLHQFARHVSDGDLRRELALMRRSEQQQQKILACLKPMDESILEHSIGHEQLTIDLTAALAQREPCREVKRALDFALLEDFDHLYRFANLLDTEYGLPAEILTGGQMEITPGRPTVSAHRHPYDAIQSPLTPESGLLSQMHALIITAAEQQTMSFYMHAAGLYASDMGRRLYQEIGMIEEQHVSQYESLMDPNMTWLENLLLHQYVECYLYYSCHETESDMRLRDIWAELYEQEVAHLHKSAQLLRAYEGTHWSAILPWDEFPSPLSLIGGSEYAREVLERQAHWTAVREVYAPVDHLPDDFDFFKYQGIVNADPTNVPSHEVIRRHIAQDGIDYRFEKQANPVQALQNRKLDNITVGRDPAKLLTYH